MVAMASLFSSALLKMKILLLSLILLSASFSQGVQSQVDKTSLQLKRDSLEWPSTASISDFDGVVGDDIDVEEDGGMSRRSLYWHSHYYISYAALAANRIPCPPRSGRSYYTHNCYKRRTPVHPYVRGCSTITRCRRDYS